jgi:hypothetical protein
MFITLKQVSKCHIFISDNLSSNGAVVPIVFKGVPGRRDPTGMLWDALLITHEDHFGTPSTSSARVTLNRFHFNHPQNISNQKFASTVCE